MDNRPEFKYYGNNPCSVCATGWDPGDCLSDTCTAELPPPNENGMHILHYKPFEYELPPPTRTDDSFPEFKYYGDAPCVTCASGADPGNCLNYDKTCTAKPAPPPKENEMYVTFYKPY